ncbi:MAG: YegP family protein [Pseudonocardia sp.]
MRFVIRKSTNSQFYFTISASGNYEVLATSETYVSKASTQRAISLIKGGASGAQVIDLT